jgi:hypothetical protein
MPWSGVEEAVSSGVGCLDPRRVQMRRRRVDSVRDEGHDLWRIPSSSSFPVPVRSVEVASPCRLATPGALAGWELGVGCGVGQVRGGGLVQVGDHGAVDVNADRAVGGRLACCGVDSGEQVGVLGGEVEDLDLVDLPLVQSEPDGFVCPEAELGVPEWAVGLCVAGVGESGEVAEDVEQVASTAQRVDELRVGGSRRNGCRLGETAMRRAAPARDPARCPGRRSAGR